MLKICACIYKRIPSEQWREGALVNDKLVLDAHGRPLKTKPWTIQLRPEAGCIVLNTIPVNLDLTAAEQEMLAIIKSTDGAEVPQEDWGVCERLMTKGYITFGAPRGPDNRWRRAEVVEN